MLVIWYDQSVAADMTMNIAHWESPPEEGYKMYFKSWKELKQTCSDTEVTVNQSISI